MRFACPSADISCARPLPGASSHRPDAATCRARSAPVVSHHLGGLLRTQARGLVASRSRPGFVAFRKRRSRSRPTTAKAVNGTVADLRAPSPRRGFTPFEECSSSTAGAASLRSVAILSLPALIRSSPRPKQRRESVLANQEPRGRRPGRSRISDPLAWAVVSCTMKLRSAANGGPPRHRGTWTPANRRPACADRYRRQRRSVACSERSSPGRGGMPARRKEADFTSDAREHPSRAVERPKPQDHSLHARSHRGDSSGPFETTRAANFMALLRRRVRSVYRRCQRVDTRSFHGLCSPPRSTRAPLQPGPCQDRRATTGRSPRRPRCRTGF
jgi:hypothetical protein